MITDSQIEVVKLLSAEANSSNRFNYERARIHTKINSSLTFITDYFDQYGVDGVRQMLIGLSTGISECEHKLIRALTPEQAVRVNKAIENGMSAQSLDADNASITDFETKLATLQLAGLSLYSTLEAQSLGVKISSSYDLTVNADGSVIVTEKPEIELDE